MRAKRLAGPRRSGAALVEFAFMVPVLLMLVLAVVEYGRFSMLSSLVRNAAREGARYAVVTTSEDTVADQQIRDWVMLYMTNQSASLPGFDPDTDITVYRTDDTGADLGTWKDATFGEMIAVRIQGAYVPLVPLKLPFMNFSVTLMPSNVSLDIVQVMMSEGN